jgi:hypothetical protein
MTAAVTGTKKKKKKKKNIAPTLTRIQPISFPFLLSPSHVKTSSNCKNNSQRTNKKKKMKSKQEEEEEEISPDTHEVRG